MSGVMILFFLAAGFLGLFTPEPGQAGGPGNVTYQDTKSLAPVVFDHGKHKDAGTKCGDCHDALFKKKAGSADAGNALTMKALREGKFCGACHDGQKAFSAGKHCKKCHQK